MSDEKDRLGNKLKDLEKAREDQWAAQRDRELLENLRRKQAELRAAAEQVAEAASDVAHAADVLCPRCHKPLGQRSRNGVGILACPDNHGIWLDAEAADKLIH